MAGGLKSQLPRAGAIQQPGGELAVIDQGRALIGDTFAIEGLGAQAAPAVRIVHHLDAICEHGLSQPVLEKRDAARDRRARNGTGEMAQQAGGFVGMSWDAGPARVGDFDAKHQWLSTSPDSGFVKVAMAERRDASGVDVVRGLTPMRIGDGAFTGEPVTDRGEWFGLLAELFDLRFEDAEVSDRLWETVVAAHRRWQAEQG